MATIIINSQGNASYGGGQGIADVFDFNTTGPTRLVVADNFIRQWTPGILSLALLGSSHADTVSIQMTGNRLDARDVTFGGGWSGRRDTLEISDTGLNSTTFGSGLRDRIEVTGGEDTVRGGEGTDTLVLSYGFRSEDFFMPADDRILGGGDTSVRMSGIERLDATLGSGDDVLRGLDGSDVLRGGSGSDELKGRDGHDSLVGGEGDDFLRGGRGDDVLNGAKGADAMTGGTGNDTYYVDDPLDRITELLGEGADTVRSRVTIELAGSQVENVVLVGSGDISVSCGDTANRITGNSGDNTITAQGGRDTILIGGDEGVDVINYGDVSESTGTSRDVVHGFDASGEFGRGRDRLLDAGAA